MSSSCSSWTNFSTASHSCEHPARDRHFLAPARPNYIQKNGATVTGLEQADSSFGFFLAKMKPSTRRLSEAGSGCLFLSCLLVQLLNQAYLQNSPRFPTMRPSTTPREDRLSRSHLQPLAMGNLRFQELFVQPHLSTTLIYHVKKN